MMRSIFLLLILFLFPIQAQARSGGAQLNSLPAGLIFPDPTGILFPSFGCAAGVNAAALAEGGKAAEVEGAYSPGKGGDPQEFFGSLAASSKQMGIGVGYLGDSLDGHMTHAGFAGAGFKIDPISLGVGLRDSNLSGKISPNVDVGMIAGGSGGGGGGSNGLRFGFVFYNLNIATQLDAGIGFSGGKKYNMEVNILLPPFSQSNGGYVVTAQGTVYAGDILGLTFRTSYFTSPNWYEHTLGISAWLSEALNVFAQFTTPHRWTGGLMFTF